MNSLALALFFAQVAPSDTGWITTLWDIAQKAGAGATVVLAIGFYYLAKAYVSKDAQLAEEVKYSKDRDKQTLIVMTELSSVIKGVDSRESKSTEESRSQSAEILKAISELKTLVRDHFIRGAQTRDAA